MAEDPPLWEKMRELAETHPRGDELREKADAFEAVSKGFFAEPQTHSVKQLIGAWAQARKFWCDLTGEPLV
jgi:hypothetical protein